jgi:dGTPase
MNYKNNPLYRAEDFIRLSGKLSADKDRKDGWLPFQKDYARLLHSASFRRLQGKTQLFPSTESDFFRNRLTHSLEVAQIAAGITRFLNARKLPKWKKGAEIDVDLVQFAAIAHDLGHPPFGHNGEHALDQLMSQYGGFEGNAQTLRILAVTEKKLVESLNQSQNRFLSEHGLNLTHRALASVLKYDHCIPHMREEASGPNKGYYAVDKNVVENIKRHVAPEFKGEKFKTIECAIMDLADDIAYSTYDLEDSLHAGFTTPMRLIAALMDEKMGKSILEKVNKALGDAKYTKVKDSQELTNYGSAIFGLTSKSENEATENLRDSSNKKKDRQRTLLAKWRAYTADQRISNDALIRTQFTAERVGKLIRSVQFVKNDEFPQLSGVKLSRDVLIEVELLKRLNYELVIRSPRLAVIEHRGHELVTQVFEAIVKSDGKLLPEEWKEDYFQGKEQGVEHARRVICDYVATLTDGHAAELHGRLFSDGHSMFKPL